MAWDYQITRLATSSVTSSSWAASRTSSASSSAMTSGTIQSITNVATTGATTWSQGETAFFGTFGAPASVTVAGPATITIWESWQLFSFSSSSTFSQTASLETTVGTTRTVLTGTGGTKRESSYLTVYLVTLATQTHWDQFFIGGSSFSALTLQTFVSRTSVNFEDTAGVVSTITTTSSGQTIQSASQTFTNNRTFWYSSTTVSTTANTTATVTTTENQTYSFPTSTTGPGTTSTSST